MHGVKEVREPTSEGGERNKGRKGKERRYRSGGVSISVVFLLLVEATPFEQKHQKCETEREAKNNYHNKQKQINTKGKKKTSVRSTRMMNKFVSWRERRMDKCRPRFEWGMLNPAF